MTNLTLTLSDATTWTAPLLRVSEAPRWVGYRVPHDTERNNYDAADKGLGWAYTGRSDGPVRDVVIQNNVGRPEVYGFDRFQTLLSCSHQLLWAGVNPDLPRDKVITLMDYQLAWCNTTGVPNRYTCLSNDPRPDGMKDVAFSAAIINGGAYLQGTVTDGLLDVETIRSGDPVPPAEWVLARPWLWFYGTNIRPDGKITYMVRKSKSGEFIPVRVPLITSQPLRIPLAWLHAWNSDALPDPLRIGG